MLSESRKTIRLIFDKGTMGEDVLIFAQFRLYARGLERVGSSAFE